VPGARECPACGAILAEGIAACPICEPRSSPLLADPLVGRVLSSRYLIVERVGKGGMANVYLARRVLGDGLVAVKALRRDLAVDPTQRDRFLREGRALNRIRHPNIVAIEDVGETEDGLVYLVMEYLKGRSLHDVLEHAPLSARRIVAIAEQVTAALASAHSVGVVHRDLKPENVLVFQEGNQERVKVLDFGIAKISDAPAITGSQQLFGTPGYIAPEYIQNGWLDGRADLYSLGVVMYEMATGVLPFDYEYPGDLLVKHCIEVPTPPSKRVPTTHPALEQLILRSLEKHPDNRFKDAAEMQAELRELADFLAEEARWGGEDDALPSKGVSSAGFARPPIGEPTQPLATRAGRVTPT
jgi:serine/threonine protein kinase